MLRGAVRAADVASPMPLSRRNERDTSCRLHFGDPTHAPDGIVVVGGAGRAHCRVL